MFRCFDESFKECRGVVDECVDSRELSACQCLTSKPCNQAIYLLKKRNSQCHKCSSKILRADERNPLLQADQKWTRLVVWIFFFEHLSLESHFGEDTLPFQLYLLIVHRASAQLRKSEETIFLPPAHCEPSRREWEEMNRTTHYQCRKHLQKEWKPE